MEAKSTFIKLIKGVLPILGLLVSVISWSQDSSVYFPWIQNGQICQIQPSGKIRIDTSKKTLKYPIIDVSNELKIYDENGWYGLKDMSGNIVIKAGYEEIGHFREGFAWVKIDHSRYYYIDRNEQPLVHFSFDRCFDFQNGLARVFDKNKRLKYDGFGYIDATGKIVINLQYKKAFDFVGGFALVQDKEKKWWLINQEGEKVQGPCTALKVKKGLFSSE